MASIAILGYGVVGSGVVEVIGKNRTSISRKTGENISVKKILEIKPVGNDNPDASLITSCPDDIFNDKEISIIVETIGGIKAAYEFTKRAFESGKHVVTSNKELVATYGPELLKLAHDSGVRYLFEGSVGGGIPIIRPLNQCLAANEITGITGILNGTTNYILTKIKKEGMDFATALKNAQLNGYAEADPTSDIDGHDASRKIAILSSIAYGEFVDYRNIPTEGITGITALDMEYAETCDSAIKLIAESRNDGGIISARVGPVMISKSHPLAGVEDVFNAIVVKGNVIGDAMFYGRGAGKLPTASAVTADIIDIVSRVNRDVHDLWERKPFNNLIDAGECITRFFVRTVPRNYEEAKKFIIRVFNDVDFIQLNKLLPEEEIAFITHNASEKELRTNINRLRGIGSVKEVAGVIRYGEE